MLSRARTLKSDAARSLARRLRQIGLVLAVLATLAAAALGGYIAAGSSEADPSSPAPAPQVVVRESPAPEETEDLGFPAFATKNTTRVAGSDPVADAAGVALAAHPSTGDVPGPDAVTLVEARDWHGGIAAASLAAAPIGAPILITEDGELPDLTVAALAALAPEGSEDTGDHQAFAIGAATAPRDLEAFEIEGTSPAEVAARIERLRTRLAGEPDHIVLTSSEEPGLAMPAASWAARSGDPVLYVDRDSIPGPTRRALRRHREAPVYVLGPPAAISDEVLEEVRELNSGAERISGEDPVRNAIAFARYADGSFGWNINDPGHGFVIANADRPLDAAAAAPLSAAGTWGPLLLTDDAAELPPPLRAYLLDLKPGYEDDPTRAVYNHIWVIGDADAIGVELQAEIDDLAELIPVSPGRGSGEEPPAPDERGDGDEPRPRDEREDEG